MVKCMYLRINISVILPEVCLKTKLVLKWCDFGCVFGSYGCSFKY